MIFGDVPSFEEVMRTVEELDQVVNRPNDNEVIRPCP
jgi:hypothetical protein